MKTFLHCLFCTAASLATLCADTATHIPDKNTLQLKNPAFARRKTAKLRLANGAEMLIISDPDIEKSAAALAMEVGSWSDPTQFPGTAHFTEHLLFLGSEPYPEEDGFMKYVAENGGSVNAFTASDRTVYMFSVNNDAFSRTLDQFAHLFIDPLFTESGIERELHAVDQENDKNRQSDGARELMVLKELAASDHPFAKFSTGNANTLGSIPRSEVVRWQQTYYGGNNAHIVLYTNQDLDTITAYATELFSAIPEGAERQKQITGALFKDEYKGRITYIKPYKELREINLYWELPTEFVKDSDFKTARLLSHVLNSKHPHSIYTMLRKEGLVEDFSAGSVRLASHTGVFSINAQLTQYGAENIYGVIDRIFSALTSIQKSGIPPYIFQELRSQAQLNYEYQEKTDPFTYVSNNAARLIDEPLETYPEKSTLPIAYDPQRVQLLLSLLTPESALYCALVPDAFETTPSPQKEHWFGVEYAVRKIPETTLRAWRSVKPSSDIAIQKPNPYLPKNLTLFSQKGKNIAKPYVVYSEPLGKLYFAPDTTYLVPNVAWYIGIKTPSLKADATSNVLSDLFIRGVGERLNSTLSYAEAAGFSYELSSGDYALHCNLCGYSDTASALLQKLLTTMRSTSLSEEEFYFLKNVLLDAYENKLKDLSIVYALTQINNVLLNNRPRPQDKYTALRNLTYDQYQAFEKGLFDQVYFEVMTTGNMNTKHASEVWQKLTNTIGKTPFPEKAHPVKKALTLPEEGGPFKITQQGLNYGNVALLLLQNGAFTFEDWAPHALLGQMLNADFFKTLRTKQQTGYIAKGWTSEIESELLQMFAVQSTTHQPDELLARFELFLEEYVKEFETLVPRERFEQNKNALLTQLRTPPYNLRNLAQEFEDAAFIHKGDFERRSQKARALEELSYERFKRESIANISRNNSRRLAYLLIGKPLEGKQFHYTTSDAETLKSLGSYISWQD